MPFNSNRYVAAERVHLPDRRWPDRVLCAPPIWCSVDLRDGNQALPDPMGHERKRALLELLLEVGFKQIELGFPAASQTDFDFVRWVVESGRLPAAVIPQVITQAREPLIERTFAAIVGAPRAIVHLYNSTSELQRRVVFGMSRAQIVALAVNATLSIRAHADALPGSEITLQYSPESFTGTEPDFALEICNAVIEAWNPNPKNKLIVNLPSTVENTSANLFADRIEWMSRNLARRDSLVLSVHTHNDRGSGVASAELAVLAGAERVEGTLLGNGERSGNVDILTLALNLYSQGIDPGLVFADMPRIVRSVEECTRLPVHPRHPYAGELVFTAFSGSHQDAIHKGFEHMRKSQNARWEVPYLPIDPADIGRAYEPVIRINSQSGKSGLLHVLERDHGYRVPRALAIELSQSVQRLADARGEELASNDVCALFEREYVNASGRVVLDDVGVERRASGRECAVSARVRIDGVAAEIAGIGKGPIEAFAHALGARLDAAFDVVDYVEHARQAGADAEAVAFVAVKLGDAAQAPRAVGPAPAENACFGAGVDADVVIASLRALVSALNRALGVRSARALERAGS